MIPVKKQHIFVKTFHMKKLGIVLFILSFVWNACTLLHKEGPKYNNLKKIPLVSNQKTLNDSFSHQNNYIAKDSTYHKISNQLLNLTFANSLEIKKEKSIQKAFHIAHHIKPQKPIFGFPSHNILAKAPKAESAPTDDLLTLLLYILIIVLILAILAWFLPDLLEILIAVFLIILLILLILYLAGNLKL